MFTTRYRFAGILPHKNGEGIDYDTGIDLYLLEPILADTDVQLAWQVLDEVPLNTYSFAVHLEDGNGVLVHQVESMYQ